MKYIRTENGVYEVVGFDDECIIPSPIIKMYGRLTHCIDYKNYKQANTIEELCDEFVVVFEDKHGIVYDDFEWAKIKANENLNAGINAIIYGAIWTDKGLIYVAKMNNKGNLELI